MDYADDQDLLAGGKDTTETGSAVGLLKSMAEIIRRGVSGYQKIGIDESRQIRVRLIWLPSHEEEEHKIASGELYQKGSKYSPHTTLPERQFTYRRVWSG